MFDADTTHCNVHPSRVQSISSPPSRERGGKDAADVLMTTKPLCHTLCMQRSSTPHLSSWTKSSSHNPSLRIRKNTILNVNSSNEPRRRVTEHLFTIEQLGDQFTMEEASPALVQQLRGQIAEMRALLLLELWPVGGRRGSSNAGPPPLVEIKFKLRRSSS